MYHPQWVARSPDPQSLHLKALLGYLKASAFR